MFALTSSHFLPFLTYTSSAVNSVSYWNHYVAMVLLGQDLFSVRDRKRHQESGSTDSLAPPQKVCSCFCYMNSQLLVLKNGSGGWLCLHFLSVAPRLLCIKHSLQRVKDEEEQQEVSRFVQKPNPCHKSTRALWGGKTVGKENQAQRSDS